ncbi:MAG: hypothetical protein IPK03_08455 [Bacteroidetes bacterium]|nr:hypothetical protein [Bacteroidota bacterium]
MKKLIIIFIFLVSNHLEMDAQFNNKVNTITTTSASPPVFRYDQMGQITIFDHGNANSSVIVSNDIDNGAPSIRVESITDAMTINYNGRLLGPGGNEIFATDVDYSDGNGTADYIICGYTHDPNGNQVDKMFLFKKNGTLSPGGGNITELSLGINGYGYTYAIDVLAKTKGRNIQ